ncbi:MULTISPECIES: hypothetical protein [Lysinibacillus]|uniref:hypothetical protein n=1 Tax=Lysinibacillus TaxID=400634 RepID=UPI00131A166A|nr:MULTISPECIES: hypothetical protein [Lysinibacillus]
MNGKKVTIIFVGMILLVCLAIFIVFRLFFATYDPTSVENVDEPTISTEINEAS